MKRDQGKVWLALLLGLVMAVPGTLAQTADDAADAEDAAEEATEQADEYAEEIVVLGSRSSKPRSLTDSPVPVDVIPAADFNATGNTADLTDNLKTLVPSYTATPATGDGSAFVRPTSLRGTAPDQTLVLVNGKRRHRSALVQFFAPAAGNGAHGVDVGMLPGIAIERVEVLRDGAAAQYGSDAIAGVINFKMKDSSQGSEVQLQYGEHYEGEQSLKAAVNAGFSLGATGFANISLEHVDNDALSRGVQRAGRAGPDRCRGVGSRRRRAVRRRAARPDLGPAAKPSGTRFFVNAGFNLAGDQLRRSTSTANYADTDGRYRFFYRTPQPPEPGAVARPRASPGCPAGYTPFLDGAQKDLEPGRSASYRFAFANGRDL